MRVLFVHQNCPGQYRNLAPQLAANPAHQVAFITQPGKPNIPGVTKVEYRPTRPPQPNTHQYLRGTEAHILNGQGAARAALTLKERGFTPDVIYAHPGWGESLYLKDVFPGVPLILSCEFYYHSEGADVGFDPEYPVSLDDRCRVRTKNLPQLLSLAGMDQGVSPTSWQRSRYPEVWQGSIQLLHDGIDTTRVIPEPETELTLPNGKKLTRKDKVVTYVARNLEPYRGFPTMMRVANEICRRRNDCHVVFVGGDHVSYGRRLPEGECYRQRLLKEIPIDSNRVHFLGWLPYAEYLKVIQVSSVHIYLTYPFVLSWSILEAMAAECVVIGSRTAPVEEVLVSGENGLLADFFSSTEVTDLACQVLDRPSEFRELGVCARKRVIEKFDLEQCLQAQIRLLSDWAERRGTSATVP